MRMSTLFGRTLREAPSEADHPAHQLVLRAGLARSLSGGGHALLPLGMRVARRIEAIMHAELASINAQELRMPAMQTRDQRSDMPVDARPSSFIPRHGGPAIAELAQREITSYRQMPTLVYQIHPQYRDATRARSGLLRMREFTMLEAYSLDADSAGLDRIFDQVTAALEHIFRRCEVQFVAVETAVGEMGGYEARAYMALSAAGEDTLVICPTGDYAANLAIATSALPPAGETTDAPAIEPVATPHCATIADLAALLDIPKAATAKAVFFDTPEYGLLFVVIRGDQEVNETKLRAALKVSALAPASAAQIAATGAVAGYASPIGLHNVTVIADQSVVRSGPLVAGANQEGYHLRNVVYGRDWQTSHIADIATVREGDPCPRCNTPLIYERGIEIGHSFKLGTGYTAAIGATYLDANGVAQPVVMGAYGIGVERLIQVIVEQHHDDSGIIWPVAVAPADVHLIRLGKKDSLHTTADALYAELEAAGLRVLYDDRDESAGVKFNDSDLIGLAVRLVLSERLLATQAVEVKPRVGAAVQIAREAAVETIQKLLASAR